MKEVSSLKITKRTDPREYKLVDVEIQETPFALSIRFGKNITVVPMTNINEYSYILKEE